MAAVKAWTPSVGDNIANPTTGCAYQIGAKLGEGGFGFVRECVDLQNGLECVAKFAKPEGMIADVRKRWDDECALMLSVDDPHIIRLYDFFRYRNLFWMIMERAECSLRERIRRGGAFSHQGTVIGGMHMLRALRELNAKNIVHRDLHIDNILWSTTGGTRSIKIADFGIAKQLMFADAVATTRIGRLYDVAPDLHLDGYTTHQSDLYQIGLAMYFVHQGVEVLSAKDGPPRDAILSGVARERAESLGTPLGDFIAVLLRRRAQYRYQDSQEAIAELTAIAPQYDVHF
jgi:serine/threonine protein kinase